MAKAKRDIKTEATRTLYAGAGVADLAVEAVRDYVADVQARFVGVQKDVQTRVTGVQKQVTGIELTPAALRDQALTVVTSRVADLQSGARALPTRVQGVVEGNVAVATTTYAGLAERGEKLVVRVRRQESTQQAKAAAASTTTKARTTTTQAKKAGATATQQTRKSASATTTQAGTAAKRTTSTAKRSTGTATKATATKAAPAKSSAKATTTTAKKTAAATAKAATDAATKVGD